MVCPRCGYNALEEWERFKASSPAPICDTLYCRETARWRFVDTAPPGKWVTLGCNGHFKHMHEIYSVGKAWCTITCEPIPRSS